MSSISPTTSVREIPPLVEEPLDESGPQRGIGVVVCDEGREETLWSIPDR